MVTRYLDSVYPAGEDESRSVDSMFIHVAADVVWLVSPDAPAWHHLDVDEMVMHLCDAPHWDDTWLLHAMATLLGFYQWLGREGVLDPAALSTILGRIDRHIAVAMTNLGLTPDVLPGQAN
jgi:hypothetical protein